MAIDPILAKAGDRWTVERIDAEAAAVRRELCWHDMPLDSFAVANALHVPVHSGQFTTNKRIVAVLKLSGGDPQIQSSTDIKVVRQIFAIAMAIGLYRLYPTDEDNSSSVIFDSHVYRYAPVPLASVEDDGVRIVCEMNRFASSLLMPEEPFRVAFKHGWRLNGLARAFGVSRDAITFRLNELNLWPDAGG